MNKIFGKQAIIGCVINIACILILIAVILPLLMIAPYNYPSADDWSYGAAGYHVLQNGGGLLDVLKASAVTTWNTYQNVEGRFVGIFMATLQPGIWGEHYYVIVPWILLGIIILAETLFFKSILCEDCGKENKYFWFPVIAPALVMQILYCPSTEESFYWYTGAMYYTFSFGLSLLLMVLFWRIGTRFYPKFKCVFMKGVAAIIAIFVGGMNFGTSLACFLTLIILSIILWFYDKKGFLKTIYLVFLEGISLGTCVFAPGNTNRINTNFGGETQGIVEAVWMSLMRSFTNIYSWTNIKVILMLLFILPFVWVCVNNVNYKFRFPGLFTLLTFCLYASQCAPTMYIDGTTGGGRMAAVLFYSYYIWLLGNFIYWIGWFSRYRSKIIKMSDKKKNQFYNFVIPYCAIVGVLLMALIYTSDLRQLSSYRAYRNWRQGWAQQYSVEWRERLEVLHDEKIKVVEFEPLSVYPEGMMYADLQEEDGFVWVNAACANYYNKESVVVISSGL